MNKATEFSRIFWIKDGTEKDRTAITNLLVGNLHQSYGIWENKEGDEVVVAFAGGNSGHLFKNKTFEEVFKSVNTNCPITDSTSLENFPDLLKFFYSGSCDKTKIISVAGESNADLFSTMVSKAKNGGPNIF